MEKISISIWKNNHKEKENHPDYRINAKIGEKWEDYGALWIKKTGKGDTFLSGLFGKNEKPETNKGTEQIKIEDINFN